MSEQSDSTPKASIEQYRVTSVSRGNAAAGATNALREAILDGILPAGEWLREVSLASALGVSRTPLREALRSLEDEGLVVRESGAGARVTTVSIDDMSVIYHVRGSLESLAARYAATRIDEKQISTFESLQQTMRVAAAANDSKTFAHANLQFHQQLAISANNAYLTRLLAPVEVALRRFGGRSLTQDRMPKVIAEHDALLQAFADRDPEAAAAAAAVHAEVARTSTLERMIHEL